MATFVLVHGAWHGGWCWYKMVARLEARGHRVLAPDLPGHGRDRSLAGPATLADYVRRIADILAAEPAPVVLVGHSMGGAVITGAAETVPDKVEKLVYLSAVLDTSGRSMMDGASAGRAPAAAAGQIVPSPDGQSTVFKNEGLREAFYADCPEEDVVLARLCLTPQSLQPMTAPVVWTAERFGRISKAYIACAQDRIKGDAETQRADIAEFPDVEFLVIEASHSPFFSRPDELADMLERLAGD
jgi:pimeloyl-ACP methyl ester carboxylesterase